MFPNEGGRFGGCCDGFGADEKTSGAKLSSGEVEMGGKLISGGGDEGNVIKVLDGAGVGYARRQVEVTVYYLLRKARGMCPAKGDAKEGVSVSRSTNPDTAYIGLG